MKKNVWILNHYASDTYFDKGGRHYWFAQYLKKNGYSPIIFAANSMHGRGDYYFDDNRLYSVHNAEKIDVPYVFVKARSYDGNGKDRVFNMLDFYKNLKRAVREYSNTSGKKPDVILASSVHPLTILAGIKIAKYFGIKCICEIRDLWPESIVAYGLLKRDSAVAKLLYAGEKYLYKKSDDIIMTWEGGYEYIEDRNWNKIIPKEKVHHISNGVDLDSFNSNCLTNQFFGSFEEGKKYFVYTGSIRRVNNVGLLVDAAIYLKSINKDAIILIFGDGDEKKNLEEKIKEHKLDNILFMGKVKKEEIPSILQHCYASVLHNSSTSLDKYGQSQNKFFEYLAAGKPIIMTYSVGYSIVERENCGIELKTQSAKNIAEAINDMCNISEDKYANYCKNASELAYKYDFKFLTKKLIQIIEK